MRSKIMIVGEGRAGKTALTDSIVGKPFRETLPSTIGIEELSCEVPSQHSLTSTVEAAAAAATAAAVNTFDIVLIRCNLLASPRPAPSPSLCLCSYIITATNATVLILKSFGDTILHHVRQPPSRVPDLAKEER
jgi:hypothetical protein